MATAAETLRATLTQTAYRALTSLAQSTAPLSGRGVAAAIQVSPTTAVKALRTLRAAGFAVSEESGRATLWRLAVSNPSISAWLEEVLPPTAALSTGSSPYSTGGGGVRLEHSYAACLVAALLAGDALAELGDAISVDSIRLQASDVSEVDDIVLEGRDAIGELHRSSVAVRRSPSLTKSDSPSVPLVRDFLTVVNAHWDTVTAGRWRLVLAVATNTNAVTQLAGLADLARSVANGSELADRLTQPQRTNEDVRHRYDHVKGLVEQAAEGLASGLTTEEQTWRFLSSLTVRTLRLEKTDRADRTAAVNSLQRVLHEGTPAAADALFSRIEELVGGWASQAAVLNQAVIRRALGDFSLLRSPQHARAWATIDRLGARLRDSIKPSLRAGAQTLEFERQTERSRLDGAMRSAGTRAGGLVVTGDPDVGKSALSLRVAEALQGGGAAVASLSLRDIPPSLIELENHLGGFGIGDVLAAGESRSIRLLVVDGAEAVLEGRGPVLQAMAAAALKAGIGVVAVTRTDGSRQVLSVLTHSCELAGISTAPVEHGVGPLTPEEREELAATFPALARLRGDERANWLLGRPGLIDVLLRTGETLDPADFLCEADVYSAVWRSVIRADEVHAPGGASPDDRENAALSVARRRLGLPAQPVHGTASAELRSDGVLQFPNNPALSTGDDFSTDLFRDFAICRLFLAEGWEALASAGGPRWAIRAARLGCEATLVDQGAARAWEDLSTQFGQIARSHGERWLEVPFEALLTLGDAAPALRSLWETLTSDDYSPLATLLRLAEARYVEGTIGDAFALAPLVKVVFCDRPTIGRGPHLGHRSLRDVIEGIVLAWLRGMAISRPQPDSLRQAVRDVILADDPLPYDEFAVEALALTGSDLDDRAEAWLRQVAKDRPDHLGPAVESFAAALTLSQTRPRLLLDLAEAYYIELPDPHDHWSGGHMLDDGIRSFHHGPGIGFGVPAAAWYYGPFFRLLNTVPLQAVAMINRVLDHAARHRVAKLSNHEGAAVLGEDAAGVDIEIPGAEARHYVGDSHVWSWYRASSVGPYPCMSALLALERFADHLLESVHVPANVVVEFLLRDCHNLAVPGLIVGFLTRHPDEATDLLDPFLAHPQIWHLEASRVSGEHFTVRDGDANRLTGLEYRSHTPHHTVAAMVVNARARGDGKRLGQLSEVGNQLLENANAGLSGAAGESEYIAMIEGWAALFRPDNYRASSTDDGILIQFERPAEIEKVLAPGNLELQAANTLFGLQNRYGRHNDDPESWPLEDLSEDLATARRIEDEDSVPRTLPWPENAIVAVAAAAVRAYALGRATLDRSDLVWAADTVMWAAEHPAIDEMSYSGSMFSMGADRAAAAAAPLLLLGPFDDLDLDSLRVDGALRSLATSVFDEVRAIYVKGCEPLWGAPCVIDKVSGKCRRHESAWLAAMSGLADCRLGPWNQVAQRREPARLSEPFSESLPSVAAKDLLVNRLRMPLACMVDAHRVPCLQNILGDLWTPLWDAHRRGLAHWWKKGYDHHAHITHDPIARRMVTTALSGDRDPVKAHIEAFAKNSNALHLLFEGFATVFTYEASLRKVMGDFWPWAMGVALEAIGDGKKLRSKHHWFDYMTAALLPTPNPRSWDQDIDGTLTRCREDWLQPEALEGLADRWLKLARWEPKAVDAVIKFGNGAPRAWQTTVAPAWIEAIIDDRFDLIANHLYYLEEWLNDLRNAGLIVAEVADHYHRIVDGLAAAGDRAAVRLQKLDE